MGDRPGSGTSLVSGSHATEHLANERTFLAWVRTSLGLIGLGFVLARMGLFLRQLTSLGVMPAVGRLPAGGEFMVSGVLFLLLGTLLAGWSGLTYLRVRKAIEAGGFKALRMSVTVVTIVVVIGGLFIAGLVVKRTVQPVEAENSTNGAKLSQFRTVAPPVEAHGNAR